MSGPNTVVQYGMTLAELAPELAAGPHATLHISGLSLDSRDIKAGDAFVAVSGARHHGIEFRGEAASRGATVVLCDAVAPVIPALEAATIPLVMLEGLESRISALAGRFYAHPSEALGVIGITGTNGKTTCSQLIAQAFGLLDMRCGIIGTLGWGFPEQLHPTQHTTPDAVRNQRLLAGLRDAGATQVAMEVSSHALTQGRVRAIRFAMTVFTNLTRDHLDYHHTLEEYGASKSLLFKGPGVAQAVVNADDAFGRSILESLPTGVHAISYGVTSDSADVGVISLEFSNAGIRAFIRTPWGNGILGCPLIGRFNLSNALAALCVLCLHDVPLLDALSVFPLLHPVRGRMERIDARSGPTVVVDYAHTPDALEQALRALRQHCIGRLWCVFGCGGDRDPGKRSLMGRIAHEHADEVFVTSDNPRSESPEAIIAEILAGIPNRDVKHDPNRAYAITQTITAAALGDWVLIAGKGHEDYQEIQGRRLPFSDVEVARGALDTWEAHA